MTRYDPSLRLARMVVFKDGQRAYDERFHAGVNIIRGIPGTGNSVGKSTIAELIFYSLGGDLASWKEEAGLCDEVYSEVVCNGATITLRREITDQTKQPMWIAFAGFDEAIAKWPEIWQRYTYSRLGDRESFSQILFRSLGIPEVQSEADANITMHQLLRTMYVDQLTPVDRIFRFEANDSAMRRQAVGDLLCGVLDKRIYPAQLELREVEKRYSLLTQQYRTLLSVLSADGEGFNLDFVNGRIQNIKVDINAINLRIEKLQIEKAEGRVADTDRPDVLREIKQKLDLVNADLTEAEIEEGQLSFAINDANMLIAEIRSNLSKLIEGEEAARSIGPISFNFCPSCFSTLDEKIDGICQLCQRATDPTQNETRIARMRNELEQQLKESVQIQRDRYEEIERIKSDIADYRSDRSRISAEYNSLSRGYTSEADAELSQLIRQSGYLEREMREAEKELKIALQLQAISDQRDTLNNRITRLKEDILRWSNQRDRRQGGAYYLVSKKTADILGRDIHTEEEFSEDSKVYFNFAEDRISVNQKSSFSASSQTVLRNAFHLALLAASCFDPKFLYPRFLLMDNIEDKGMTQERSQRFQKIILETSRSISVEHQIIFTTSMISDEMESTGLTVGEMYTYERKSLKVGRRN